MAMPVIKYYRVTSRPNLFMGGDRELVMFTGVIAFALIFALQTFASIVVGSVLWIVAVSLLRMMAKYDPDIRKIYLSDSKYEKFYFAHSSPAYVNSEFQGKFYRNPVTIYK